MDSYDLQIDDMHYNSKKVIQVSKEEHFEDLEKTLKFVESELKAGSHLEENMLSFFKGHVEPMVAYRDNDVNQGKGGPKRLYVIGKLKLISDYTDNLFVRLGVRAPRENPLISALQVLYLADGKHTKYIAGEPRGSESDPDRWFYDFTSRYQGMVKDLKVRTRTGIKSLSIIPAINEILTGKVNNFEVPKY